MSKTTKRAYQVRLEFAGQEFHFTVKASSQLEAEQEARAQCFPKIISVRTSDS